MGNRAVITTRDAFDHNGLGIYVHWNGGRDSVNAFLTYCAMKQFASPETDCYGWARLIVLIVTMVTMAHILLKNGRSLAESTSVGMSRIVMT